jgi:hypothetical protein
MIAFTRIIHEASGAKSKAVRSAALHRKQHALCAFWSAPLRGALDHHESTVCRFSPAA